jgi:hypothetical protein
MEKEGYEKAIIRSGASKGDVAADGLRRHFPNIVKELSRLPGFLWVSSQSLWCSLSTVKISTTYRKVGRTWHIRLFCFTLL